MGIDQSPDLQGWHWLFMLVFPRGLGFFQLEIYFQFLDMLIFSDVISKFSDDEVIDWVKKNSPPDEDIFGTTVATQAAYDGRSRLVARILEEKLSKARSYGSSVIGGAFQCDSHDEGATILRTELQKGYSFEDEDIVKADYIPELNEPLVHAAIRRRRDDLLSIIIQAGAPLNMRDSRGTTANELLSELNLVLCSTENGFELREVGKAGPTCKN